MKTWQIVGLVIAALVVIVLVVNYFNTGSITGKKKCGCKGKPKESGVIDEKEEEEEEEEEEENGNTTNTGTTV